MGRRQLHGARGTVVLGIVSVLSAAVVAAQPASAGGNGNGNGNAYGQAKKQPPTAPTPTPTPTPTQSTGTDTGPTADPDTPPGPPANSVSATLALLDANGKRASVAADAVEAVITVTNTSTTGNSFSSAVISILGGFTPCPASGSCPADPTTDTPGFHAAFGVGPTVHPAIRLSSDNGVDGIAPGSAVTISAWVHPPQPPATCTVAGLAWPVVASTAHDLTGGTAFPVVQTAPVPFLRISAQPPTATAYNTDMSPAPAVTSYDGCGVAAPPSQQVTLIDGLGILASPSGTEGTVDGNTTTFSALQFSDFDMTDTLTAQADNYTSSDPSDPFLVAEKVEHCNASTCDPLTLDSQPKTNAVITPTAGQDDSLVSGSALSPDTDFCGEGDAGLTDKEVSSTIAVDASVAKTVTFTIAKPLVHAISNNGTPFMNVCMRTVDPDTGAITDVNLPNCPSVVQPTTDACVVSRGKHKAAEIIVVHLPAGDPHFNVH